jgi:peptidoglycan/xylan/chitin deacetylase (PgdA/CDA1 family)
VLRRRRAIAACSVLALLGGAAVLLGARHRSPAAAVSASTADTGVEPAPAAGPTAAAALVQAKVVVRLGEIPDAVPGRARVVSAGPAAHRRVALTFDDGFCARCVRDLVRAVERTGAHVTFCPNGAYAQSWEAQRGPIRRMLATGQVAMCNHTFSHADLRHVDAARKRDEIDRNERWIERTFGVTARPYVRPPYGAYDSAVLAAAGDAGFTRVVMWSGTLADSSARTEDYLVEAIRYWAKPGAIILAHGNYPATPRAFDKILAVLRHKHLRTATLPELLGS